jgi:EmrB/QacA subfamily drug resistance transporter
MSNAASPPMAGATGGKAGAISAPAPSGGLTHRQILTILSGLMMGMFLASLDQTIVSTSIRVIADDLNGLSQQAWVTTAYLITSTITTPLYGKLSDIYGRKPFFISSIIIFVLGSAACTFSTSMIELAGFRAFQGIGAGGLMSLALAIIGDIVPPRERARYQGYMLAVFATSTVLGPLLGGFLSGQDSILGIAGWRWVFLVNVPIGVIALFVVAKVLNLPHTRRDHRIDWWGALTIVIGVVPLLLVAEQGREWGWTGWKSLTCYGVGLVGLVVWVFVERAMKDEALIPMRLFRSSVFSKTSVTSVLIGMGMFGAMMMIPQYLQIVKGESPTKAGLMTLPMVGGMMIASIASGQLTSRTGRYKIFPLIGTPLMAAAALLFYFRVEWDTPLWETMVFMGVFGLGLGGCMQTLVLAVQNAVDPKDMGVASSSSTFFRQMGATAGTAIFLSVLFSNVSGKIADAFRKAAATPEFQAKLQDPAVVKNPANAPVIEMIKHPGAGGGSTGVLNDSSFIQRLDPVLGAPFKEGFANAMHIVFLLAACIVALAFVMVLWTKEVPLRRISGIQAREQEAAAANGEAPTDAVAATPADAPTAEVADLAGMNGGRHRAPVGAGMQAQPGSVALAERALALQTSTKVVNSLNGTTNGAAPLGAEIRGLVRSGEGTPVPSAVVTLIDLGGRQLGRAATGGDGRYALGIPGSGTFVLIGSADAHQPQAATVVVDGNGLDYDLVLSSNSGLAGTVTDSVSGEPLPGALVVATDARGEVVASGIADAGGGYVFPQLVPGAYTLAVSGAGHRPTATPVEVAAGGTSRQDVGLAPGARLAGVVRAAGNGRPLADARVTLLNSAGSVVAATVTGEDGSYGFTDLDSGEYTVIASGYAPVATPLRVNGSGASGFDLALGHEGTQQAEGDALGRYSKHSKENLG